MRYVFTEQLDVVAHAFLSQHWGGRGSLIPVSVRSLPYNSKFQTSLNYVVRATQPQTTKQPENISIVLTTAV